MAEHFRCYGCEAADFAQEALPKDQRGAYVGLILFDDEADHDRFEELDPIM